MTASPRKRHRIAHVAQRLTPGHVAPAREGDTDFAVVCAHDGGLYATVDQCPHDGGPLSDGFVAGDLLVCARHQWEFALRDGVCPYAQQRRITIWPLTRAGARATPTAEGGASLPGLPAEVTSATADVSADADCDRADRAPGLPAPRTSLATIAPNQAAASSQLRLPGVATPRPGRPPPRTAPPPARKKRDAKSGK